MAGLLPVFPVVLATPLPTALHGLLMPPEWSIWAPQGILRVLQVMKRQQQLLRHITLGVLEFR